MTRKARSQNKLVNAQKIEKLVQLMKKHKLDIIQAETEDEKICLARNVGSLGFIQQQKMYNQPFSNSNATASDFSVPNQTPVAHSSSSSDTAQKITTETKEATPQIPDGQVINCPFVGTFYRSPSPDSPPFVEIGTQVKKGQTLCIVEAMKLMNEIESEVDGKIVAILVDDAKPVEFGTSLFVIAPTN